MRLLNGFIILCVKFSFDSSTRNWMRNLPKIWGGDSIKIVWQGQVKKIIPKYMILGTSGVNWGDLGTFWSDFRMRSYSL